MSLYSGISASGPVPFFCFTEAAGGWESYGRAGRWGKGAAPLEKTEMVLTSPEGRDFAALCGLSDERRRPQQLKYSHHTQGSLRRSFSRFGTILAFRRS